MDARDSAFLFACEGEELVGVLTAPEPISEVADVGLLVVVGGPQYRVGSHRQFTLLARHLAAHGIACMRFDYRGMGDASGEQRDFEDVGADIRAALDAFFARWPALRKAVLWGLCDGASASCFYAPRDKRLAGLILANPWVKTEAGVARTYLKHYYLKRLLAPEFWKKLLAGKVAVGSSLGEVAAAARTVRGASRTTAAASADLPDRMADGLRDSALPFALILSERDYVAREFEDAALRSFKWAHLLRSPQHIETARVAADHTFSNGSAAADVASATLEQVCKLAHFNGGRA